MDKLPGDDSTSDRIDDRDYLLWQEKEMNFYQFQKIFDRIFTEKDDK